MEAFVYNWTDHKRNKLYVGSHTGSLDDGYVCSSRLMMRAYNKRPDTFTRQIIAQGTTEECRVLEGVILDTVDAANSKDYYNASNGAFGGNVPNANTPEKRKQKSDKQKGVPQNHSVEGKIAIGDVRRGGNREDLSDEAKKSISDKLKERFKDGHPTTGSKRSEETKAKMRAAWAKRKAAGYVVWNSSFKQ